MSLQVVLDLFKEITGRADLCTTEALASNVNAVTFINEGIKYLDNTFPTLQNRRWYRKDITSGEYIVKTTGIRVIHQVIAVDADGGNELKLIKTRNEYDKLYEYPISQIVPNSPAHYAILNGYLPPSQAELTNVDYVDEFTYGYELALFGDAGTNKGIVILPPADALYTIEILADFYSVGLNDLDGSNWWTINQPFLAALAGKLMLFESYGNMEGVGGLISMISHKMNGILADDENSVNSDSVPMTLGG
jgi:hypothetical protein